MTKPLISALVNTYNHERYIEQALLSVLDQGLSPSELEIVVVDDGSTDDTSFIVKKFASRVRYLHKENGGQASAFNAVIPDARGEIIAFLDGDDWWTDTSYTKCWKSSRRMQTWEQSAMVTMRLMMMPLCSKASCRKEHAKSNSKTQLGRACLMRCGPSLAQAGSAFARRFSNASPQFPRS